MTVRPVRIRTSWRRPSRSTEAYAPSGVKVTSGSTENSPWVRPRDRADGLRIARMPDVESRALEPQEPGPRARTDGRCDELGARHDQGRSWVRDPHELDRLPRGHGRDRAV